MDFFGKAAGAGRGAGGNGGTGSLTTARVPRSVPDPSAPPFPRRTATSAATTPMSTTAAPMISGTRRWRLPARESLDLEQA